MDSPAPSVPPPPTHASPNPTSSTPAIAIAPSPSAAAPPSSRLIPAAAAPARVPSFGYVRADASSTAVPLAATSPIKSVSPSVAVTATTSSPSKVHLLGTSIVHDNYDGSPQLPHSYL
ncbi:hypothetical protein PVAP13_9NG302500 [Panicum virgatum]|uniref:Uncharacterized protein n=1 Tax=Panicum virgatum TaxID=38727 RepID=A0A8T0MMA6_PANVG|nr:hypothetical protein PVAP13_9NG302500 [Panicum virgatum]